MLATRPLLLAPALALGLALISPATARADGWWEVACNSDGHEGSGGCTNPNNPSGCTCEATEHEHSSRTATVGSGLALLAVVGYGIGRKRRRRGGGK